MLPCSFFGAQRWDAVGATTLCAVSSVTVGGHCTWGGEGKSVHLSRGLGWEQQQEICGHSTWGEGREALSLVVLGRAE